MIVLAIIFLIMAVATGLIGFTGLFGSAEPAKFLCFVFLVMVALCVLIRAIRSAPDRGKKREVIIQDIDSSDDPQLGDSHVQDRGAGTRRRVA